MTSYKNEFNHVEIHKVNNVSKLNWLRASVLGANDGIVSIAGLVLGVAGATDSSAIILTSGIAGIIAGAISMAAGEYVSVSSSRDTERALLAKERFELEHFPTQELEELIYIYEKQGLSKQTARLVAQELTEHDAFAAHTNAELGIDPDNLTNPWHAAFASAGAFLLGAAIPMTAIVLPPPSIRVPVAYASVVFTLAITGALSAKAGDAPVMTAMIRVIAGGILAMSVTYGIGRLFGVVAV